ncbi:hypothetical protein GJ496_009291 [Pomphorhynchus laevis]|nr:hypothetical protein GJ496_009291 [Pomphorhynchus laevis]
MATANRRDKSIDYDAGFIKISSAIAMFICKKLIFPGVRVKLQLYGFLIICLSIIRALDMAPISSFFSNRRNFLNLIFVKFGWGWMLTLCMPFVLLTHSCDQNGSRFNIYNIMLPTFRLVIATFIWKLVTGFFTYFEVIFGARCILNRNYLVANNKFECKQHGGYWMPFIDLSGHIFLLSYTCFIMSEEAIAIDRWLTLGTALGKQYEQHELGDHNNNSDRRLNANIRSHCWCLDPQDKDRSKTRNCSNMIFCQYV